MSAEKQDLPSLKDDRTPEEQLAQMSEHLEHMLERLEGLTDAADEYARGMRRRIEVDARKSAEETTRQFLDELNLRISDTLNGLITVRLKPQLEAFAQSVDTTASQLNDVAEQLSKALGAANQIARHSQTIQDNLSATEQDVKAEGQRATNSLKRVGDDVAKMGEGFAKVMGDLRQRMEMIPPAPRNDGDKRRIEWQSSYGLAAGVLALGILLVSAMAFLILWPPPPPPPPKMAATYEECPTSTRGMITLLCAIKHHLNQQCRSTVPLDDETDLGSLLTSLKKCPPEGSGRVVTLLAERRKLLNEQTLLGWRSISIPAASSPTALLDLLDELEHKSEPAESTQKQQATTQHACTALSPEQSGKMLHAHLLQACAHELCQPQGSLDGGIGLPGNMDSLLSHCSPNSEGSKELLEAIQDLQRRKILQKSTVKCSTPGFSNSRYTISADWVRSCQ
ncbi:hypothetical protein [Hyalangium versicolor]|uniref:hypothetical protein n=1 Tax=Hyalangium versicolor TaxID=2861190 RepID=UPI001CCB9832|nr:hypothetical protein [Hyalangium versicolor]